MFAKCISHRDQGTKQLNFNQASVTDHRGPVNSKR